MAPNALLIFALTIIFVPLALSQSGELPCVICAYAGYSVCPSSTDCPYNFTTSDIPDRCKAVWYSYYYFDKPMVDKDLSAISSMVAENIDVWVSLAFFNDNHWDDLIDPKGTLPSSLSEEVTLMEKFMADKKISGVMLEAVDLFNPNITDQACKVGAFVTGLKSRVPTLKQVGVLLPGWRWDLYGERGLFDFSATNTALDFYLIDLSSIGVDCTKGLVDRHPVDYDEDPKVNTVADVVLGFSASGMDPNKVLVAAVFDVTVVGGNSSLPYTSYSKYCTRTDTGDSIIYCKDSMDVYYNLGAYLKKYFKGLMVEYLENDDYDESCGCGKFPVANTLIDGWDSLPIKCCPKIDG